MRTGQCVLVGERNNCWHWLLQGEMKFGVIVSAIVVKKWKIPKYVRVSNYMISVHYDMRKTGPKDSYKLHITMC